MGWDDSAFHTPEVKFSLGKGNNSFLNNNLYNEKIKTDMTLCFYREKCRPLMR